MHAGFDRLGYPGDDVMTSLWERTNLAWTGFYLAPAPSQPNTSWMSKAAFLRGLGWGLAPVYVGQQWTGGPGSHVLTAAQGATDAADAIALADTADVGENSVLYLDIEIGGRLPANYLAYVQAWIDGVRGTRYRPGVYCSYLDTPAQIRAANPDVFFWVFNISKFGVSQFRAADGSFQTPPVSQSGCPFAIAWQYIQGASNVPVPQADGTTRPLGPVDFDTATVLDPSQPTSIPASGMQPTPVSPDARPTITGPDFVVRTGPAPRFDLSPAEGSASINYAVEVATDPVLFDGAGHDLSEGFYASWTDSPFLAANPYQLPDEPWQALRSADRLYYRAWFTSSTTEWVDVEITTADADRDSAPSIAVVEAVPDDRRAEDSGVSGGVGDRRRTRSVDRERGPRDVEHPTVTAPDSVDRNGPPPTFTVRLPAGARSWLLQCASDPALFSDDRYGDRDARTFWTGEVLPSSVTSLALPVDGWYALRGADRICYRVACSPAPAAAAWYPQDWSTSSLVPDSAPWVAVRGAGRVRDEPESRSRVSDPDELLWRQRTR